MATQIEKLAAFLRNSAGKLEELQVQASLGKAEFTEQLEHMKKETRDHLSQAKAGAQAFAGRSKEKLDELRAKFEHLELQLALGKAETKEELERQSRKIAEALQKLKHSLS